MNQFRPAILHLFVLLLLVALPTIGFAEDSQDNADGDLLPSFSLRDADNLSVDDQALRGRVALIDFWATWCGPCHFTLPELQRLHETFADQQLLVAGISIDGGASGGVRANRFANGLGVDYPQYHDVSGEARQALAVRSVPDLFLVDADGRIRQRWIGEPEFSEVEAAVRELLAEVDDQEGEPATEPSAPTTP